MALIELKELRKSYPMQGGDVHALRGVSLSFEAGEFVSIVGTSGSGKSTLLYMLGLLSEPTSGSYQLDGQEVAAMDDAARSKVRGSQIGFVFQSFHLVPQLDVRKNVRLASRYALNGEAVDLEKRIDGLLERVGLSHRLSHRPVELSNGEMQRVAIARALLCEPRLILADEPTGNLDEANGDHVFQLLESLHKEGRTIVMVTHDLQLAERTPRVVRLRDGEVVAT